MVSLNAMIMLACKEMSNYKSSPNVAVLAALGFFLDDHSFRNVIFRS